jgi:hypothetical protein
VVQVRVDMDAAGPADALQTLNLAAELVAAYAGGARIARPSPPCNRDPTRHQDPTGPVARTVNAADVAAEWVSCLRFAPRQARPRSTWSFEVIPDVGVGHGWKCAAPHCPTRCVDAFLECRPARLRRRPDYVRSRLRHRTCCSVGC